MITESLGVGNRFAIVATLPKAVEECRKNVATWIRGLNASEVRQLFMTQLATFIDPKLFADNDFILRGIISIAVVKGAERGRLIAAIVDEAEPYACKTAHLLEEVGVRVFIGSLSEHDKIEVFLRGVSLKRSELSAGKANAKLRQVTNLPERRLITAVKRALGLLPLLPAFRAELLARCGSNLVSEIQKGLDAQRKKINVFEEYALTRVVDASGSQNYAHLQKYRVDILVAIAAPASRPLFVIKFDGKEHRSPDKARKDKYRDSLLIDADLPVLRIDSRTDWRHPFFLLYIKVLVGRIAEVIEIDFEYQNAVSSIFNDEIERITKKVASFRNDRQRIDIPTADALKILSEAFDDTYDARFHASLSNGEDKFSGWQFWQSQIDAKEIFRSFGNTIEILEPLAAVRDVASPDGFYSQMKIRQNGIIRLLRSPRLQLTLTSSGSVEHLTGIIEEAAMACLLIDFENSNAVAT